MKCLEVFLLLLALCQCVFTNKPENNTFVASNEWQEVKEGQQLTAGLHVRINLSTGKKEAKLLDENETVTDEREAALTAVSKEDEEHEEQVYDKDAVHSIKISETLEEALKDIHKGDRLALDYAPEKKQQIKAKFKSYEELKHMRENFKTDGEVITQLLYDYNNATKEIMDADHIQIQRLRILENFDYMLHQIDNAIWFIDAGGLDQLLLPLVVNETNIALRVQAMRVLGALTQNNPKAQIKVYERNFGSHLAQILSTSTHREELSSALYAFGALLRKFPLAQQRILSTSGTQALIAVLGKQCELKIKAKAATLLSDLIIEKQLATGKNADPVAAAQYAEINLPEWLKTNDYCETMDSLLTHNNFIEFMEQPDILDYILQALSSTQDYCFALWTQSPQLKHILLTLNTRYGQSHEEYRLELSQKLQRLLLDLYQRGMRHEEF